MIVCSCGSVVSVQIHRLILRCLLRKGVECGGYSSKRREELVVHKSS
jgi:hypothetical protein